MATEQELKTRHDANHGRGSSRRRETGTPPALPPSKGSKKGTNPGTGMPCIPCFFAKTKPTESQNSATPMRTGIPSRQKSTTILFNCSLCRACPSPSSCYGQSLYLAEPMPGSNASTPKRCLRSARPFACLSRWPKMIRPHWPNLGQSVLHDHADRGSCAWPTVSPTVAAATR